MYILARLGGDRRYWAIRTNGIARSRPSLPNFLLGISRRPAIHTTRPRCPNTDTYGLLGGERNPESRTLSMTRVGSSESSSNNLPSVFRMDSDFVHPRGGKKISLLGMSFSLALHCASCTLRERCALNTSLDGWLPLRIQPRHWPHAYR